LITHRDAIRVPTVGADQLFVELESKVNALAAMARTPMSTDLAVAEIKRYIPDPKERIRLHDLVNDEVTALDHLWKLPMDSPDRSFDPVVERMSVIERQCEQLNALLAVLAYFSTGVDQDELLVKASRRLCDRRGELGGIEPLLQLQMFPALMAVYSIGIAGIASGRAAALRSVLSADVKKLGRQVPLPFALSVWSVLSDEACNLALDPRGGRFRTPLSLYLHRTMRGPLGYVIPDDDSYDRSFDSLELVLGAACTAFRGRGPVGRVGRVLAEDERQRVLIEHRGLLEAIISPDKDVDAVIADYLEQVDSVW
jgi:hypothetical protein